MGPWAFAILPLAIVLSTISFVVARDRWRRHAKRGASPEASAVVLLEGNAWEACTVDGVREPWARYTTEPARGFCGVSPGLHRVVTTTSTGDAELAFVVYPGERVAWRLVTTTQGASWQPCSVDEELHERLEHVAPSGPTLPIDSTPTMPGCLVHLRTTMNLAFSRRTTRQFERTSDEDAVASARRELARLVRGTEPDEAANARRMKAASRLGEELTGRPLTRRSLRSLVSPVRVAVEQALVEGRLDLAEQLMAVGLAALPADPELSLLAAEVLVARGKFDEALLATEAVVQRGRALEVSGAARLTRLRAEVCRRRDAERAALTALKA